MQNLSAEGEYSNSRFGWTNAKNSAAKTQKHEIRTKFSWDFVPSCLGGILKRELLDQCAISNGKPPVPFKDGYVPAGPP